jgi:hypothetical protein
VILGVLLVVVFSLQVLPRANGSPHQGFNLGQIEQQGNPPSIDVKIWVSIANRYQALELDIRNDLRVDISTMLGENMNEPYEIFAVIPFTLTEVTDLPVGANYTYGFWGYNPVGVLRLLIPANVTSSTVTLMGFTYGSSLLWRNVVEINVLNVTSSLMVPTSYQITMFPQTSKLLKVYSQFYPNLEYDDITVNGQREIIVPNIPTWSNVVVLYEPALWEPVVIVVMFITLLTLSLFPLLSRTFLKSYKEGKLLSIVNKTTRARALSFSSRIHFLKQSVSSFIHFVERAYRRVKSFESSDLMRMFILCALLMVSLSFIAGPDPRLKVYVMASTQENAGYLSGYIEEGGDAVAITSYDERTEFELMTDLGIFSAVIVGDFVPPNEGMVKRWIYPALDTVRQIIVVESYSYDVIQSEIERRYADKTIKVEDVDDLQSELDRIPRRQNALGLDVGLVLFITVSQIVGASSLILVFFGLAFLASRLIEVGTKPGTAGFAEAIMYSVLYFVFTEIVYTVCTVLLGIPLGLHTSSPKVTAIGFMGFGGGSRPRMLIGVLGFVFGSLVSMKKGLRLILGFFVLLDPLTGGKMFYEVVLLFAAPYGPLFEVSTAAWSYVRAFLTVIGTAFGGWVSPSYGISTGKMLYVVGSLPMILFSKLEKSTATAMIFVCAFCAAQGGIRVAEMTPLKTFASLVPGLVSGLIFATGLFMASFAEKALRKYISQKSILE